MNRESLPLRYLVPALLGLLAACGDGGDRGGGEPGTLELSRISFEAAEGTIVNVRVARSGGSDGVASFDYSTADGTALAGADYIAANGTLTWPDVVSGNRTISITIIDDGMVEPSEARLAQAQ